MSNFSDLTLDSTDSRAQMSSSRNSSRPLNSQQEENFDSDNDMYGQIFQPGQKIDFMYSNGQWMQGSIDIALDEMVKCVATL